MNNSVAVSKKKTDIKAAYFAGFLLFVLSAPYFFWSLLGNAFGMFVVGGLLAVLFFTNRSFNKKNSYLFVYFVVLAFLYWQTSGNNINFFILLSPVLMIPFCNDEFSYKTYQCFFTIFSVVIALSIFEYVLAVLGVLSPISTITPFNSLKNNIYHGYLTLVSTTIPPLRFHGPYDEPGVVGTTSAIILCIENFNFKDKRVLITFIAGVLSLSLFFYVSVVVCWMLNRFRNGISITTIILIVAALFLAIIIVLRVPILNEYIAERLVFDSDTGFSGDNRIDMKIVNGYLISMHGNTLWFGIPDKEYYLQLVEGSSSIFTTIIVHGLLFFIAYVLFFVLYAIFNNKSTIALIIFLFIFIGTIYQRPAIFSYFYVFLFTYMARDINIPTYRHPRSMLSNRESIQK
jgi:hypothetical protein